jgi:FlaA1/EpsC-like NDP-sugar epimerase
MKRFFMSIPQAVGLVFTAMSTMHGREIFVLKMKEQSIYELAQKVIAEHGQGKKIEIKFTGLREKEKLNEVLFTEEERETMLENEQFFIILPDLARMSLSKSLYKGFDRISV